MTKQNFTRKSKPIPGASEAQKPRSHPYKAMSKQAQKAHPHRVDILRRAVLSGRKKGDE